METSLLNGALMASSGGHEGHFVTSWAGMMIYFGLMIGSILLVLNLAKKGFTGKRVPGRDRAGMFAGAFEQLYLFIENLCVGIIGPHGKKYIPLILTFWLIIFAANLVSVFFPYSPSMDFSFTLGLAIMSIAYVQWEGGKANGVMGHLSHFKGPKLTGALVAISFLIFPIEIVSELMKNVSLSIRLYGNIFGGHEATAAMNELLKFKIGEYYWGIPAGAFLVPVKFMTCLVQALIFSLLTCVYLSLVTHHHEDHGDDHGDGHDHAEALPAA